MGANEILDLVDLRDRVVGQATLKDCLEKGLLHRAVAILVVRSSGKIVLQRRNRKDLWQPGRWTLSSTGHVMSGETYEAAAKRELSEELGIVGRPRLLEKLLLPKVKGGDLTEWEHVALFEVVSDARTVVDPVELEEVAVLSTPDVKEMMKGRRLTPDAKVLLSCYFGLVRDDSSPG
jgi:isopentenyldiphosphate isomerase